MSQDEVCSICGDTAFAQTDATNTCHRLACGHSFHVDCIVQWFAHGNSTCPNCRHEEIEERLIRRNVTARISSARRRKTTPVHVRRLIQQYDNARLRKEQLELELRKHKQTNRNAYTMGSRLETRVYHYASRESMLRTRIGHMCIPGVPLADRFRLSRENEVE